MSGRGISPKLSLILACLRSGMGGQTQHMESLEFELGFKRQFQVHCLSGNGFLAKTLNVIISTTVHGIR
jgi:hypothetical protein